MSNIVEAIAKVAEAIDKSAPYELDSARALCELKAGDFEVRASTRATYKRLAQLLRKEMGPL